MLQCAPATVYEPRGHLFSAVNTSNGPQTKNMHLIGRGHPRHYFTNGGGRDTYIYGDNGGFSMQYNPVKWPEVGSIQGKPIHQKAKPAPIMHAKPVFYRADGSGRDSYIE